RATLRFHVNPLVSWVWIGMFVLIGGASISLWPELRLREVGVWGYLRATAGAATSIMLAILFATSTARAATPVAPARARPSVEATLSSHPSRSPFEPLGGAAIAVGLVVGAAAGWSGARRRVPRA